MACLRFALTAALLAAAAASLRADAADVAQLFPAGTLAYAEVCNPAELGKELAAVFKGSGLEDSLRLVHDRRDRTEDPRDLLGATSSASLGCWPRRR